MASLAEMSGIVLDADETLLWSQSGVTFARPVVIEEGEDSQIQIQGTGTLSITSNRVVWSGQELFEFEASKLMMHAISRNGSEPDFPRPCVYCQLDDSADLPAEIYFSPADVDSLEPCFRAFAQTSLLNPPPEENDEGLLMDGGGFDGFYGEVDDELISGGGDDEEDNEPATEEARAAMLAHLDSILLVPPSLAVQEVNDQFDEADDDAVKGAHHPNADGP